MKKHPIDKKKRAKFTYHGVHYSVPLRIIEKYKLPEKSDTVSIDEVFSDLTDQYSEPGVLLRGLRHKEGINQTDFAKIIGVSQTNLSAMENGRRSIGKDIAKRISKKFGIDYRIFL